MQVGRAAAIVRTDQRIDRLCRGGYGHSFVGRWLDDLDAACGKREPGCPQPGFDRLADKPARKPRLASDMLMVLRRLFLRVCAASLVAASIWPTPTAAQLPEALIERQPLQPADERQVREYVAGLLQALASNDPQTSQQARDRLLDPLTGTGHQPSTSFRLFYSGELTPRLRNLIGSNDKERVVRSSLRLAGALSTDAAVGLLLDALEADRPAVRYAAALELGRTLENVAARRAAVSENRVDQIFRTLQEARAREASSHVLESLILGLARPARRDNAQLHERAMIVMARGVSEQLERRRINWPPDVGILQVVYRAVRTEQLALFNTLGAQGATLGEDFGLASARLAGHALAVVQAALLNRPGLTDEHQRLVELIANVAENTLLLVHPQLAEQEPAALVKPAVQRALQGGPVQPAQEEIDKWIGAQGRLTQPPYAFDPEIFG